MKTLLSVITLLAITFNTNAASSPITGYNFDGNGKQQLKCFNGNHLLTSTPTLDVKQDERLPNVIAQQIERLKQLDATKYSAQLASLEYLHAQLQTQTNNQWLSGLSYKLLAGEDNCGNTLITGYHTPIIKLKKKPDSEYKYPFYQKPVTWPNNKILSRKEIDAHGKLQGLGLEIAYSNSLLQNYLTHVQGSAQAEFIDTGEQVTLVFAGKNGLEYQSLGKYLVNNGYIAAQDISLQSIEAFFKQNPTKLEPFLYQNPSYVFYQVSKVIRVVGSLGTPVVEGLTVATDPRLIPFGSILLVEYPIIEDNKVSGRNYKIMLANDRGSAITGGHIDIYSGTNAELAGQLHHYARVWLIEK